ncbi:hypothetical protein NBRC116601_03160 [Cognatishimia sp. WU-CL00825]|uniref:nitrile hydratase accessory protein n=1 Tax=Cognatishimia sp. WU-CL00825 TaxID=3127658 RepID=UPI0031083A87
MSAPRVRSAAPPEPVFEAPWHAEVFALTVNLNERGAFDWLEWTECLGKALAEQGVANELDGGDDYFTAWVIALEEMLSAKGMADAAVLKALKEAWTQAYMNTPHGEPVKLDGG